MNDNTTNMAPAMPTEGKPYTVGVYANDKHLPLKKLVEEFHLSNENHCGVSCIGFPYYDPKGEKVNMRYRMHPESVPRFLWKGGPVEFPYNVNHMTKSDMVILVEGESDTHTLYYLGYNVLGIPGANMFKTDWCKHLQVIPNVYVHVEPDAGGQTFKETTVKRLQEGGYEGNIFTFSCEEAGYKDPSELFIALGESEAKAKLALLLANAKQVPTANSLCYIDGLSLGFYQPKGWLCDENGIYERKSATDLEEITTTPVVITKHLVRKGDNTQKYEIAYKSVACGSRWVTAVCQPSEILNSRSVIKLADIGVIIASSRAAKLCSYIAAFLDANKDILPLVQSTDKLGWIDNSTFLPLSNEVIVDTSIDGVEELLAAFTSSGDSENWTSKMKSFRDNKVFRFLLAASFASPLFSQLKCRNYIVHVWCESRSGKTAALKAAISVWGNPEKLLQNFRTTPIGLENTAGFLCHLPLALDESRGASGIGFNDDIIYLLGNGQGRTVGTKVGGVRAAKSWNNVILIAGETPVYSDLSPTGTGSRIIEIQAKPFNSQADASDCHKFLGEHFGCAGPIFIKHYIDNRSKINDLYEKMRTRILAENKQDQSQGIALIATADAIVSQLFFGETENEAFENALNTAKYIGELNAKNAARDVNKEAAQRINDWIATNESKFDGTDINNKYGKFSKTTGKRLVYIISSCFCDMLNSHGFSPDSVKRYLFSQGIIRKTDNRFVINQRPTESGTKGCVVLDLDAFEDYLDKEATVEEKDTETDMDTSPFGDAETNNAV